MSKELEALNNLYVNISFIDDETIRDKAFNDLEVIRGMLEAIDNYNSTEALNIQANFINAFRELLSKTDHNVIQINITRNMAQEIVNIYEQHKNLKNLYYQKLSNAIGGKRK